MKQSFTAIARFLNMDDDITVRFYEGLTDENRQVLDHMFADQIRRTSPYPLNPLTAHRPTQAEEGGSRA